MSLVAIEHAQTVAKPLPMQLDVVSMLQAKDLECISVTIEAKQVSQFGLFHDFALLQLKHLAVEIRNVDSQCDISPLIMFAAKRSLTSFELTNTSNEQSSFTMIADASRAFFGMKTLRKLSIINIDYPNMFVTKLFSLDDIQPDWSQMEELELKMNGCQQVSELSQSKTQDDLLLRILKGCPRLFHFSVTSVIECPEVWQTMRRMIHLQPIQQMRNKVLNFDQFVASDAQRALIWKTDKNSAGLDGREAFFETLSDSMDSSQPTKRQRTDDVSLNQDTHVSSSISSLHPNDTSSSTSSSSVASSLEHTTTIPSWMPHMGEVLDRGYPRPKWFPMRLDVAGMSLAVGLKSIDVSIDAKQVPQFAQFHNSALPHLMFLTVGIKGAKKNCDLSPIILFASKRPIKEFELINRHKDDKSPFTLTAQASRALLTMKQLTKLCMCRMDFPKLFVNRQFAISDISADWRDMKELVLVTVNGEEKCSDVYVHISPVDDFLFTMMKCCPNLLHLKVALPPQELNEISKICPKLVWLHLCPEWHYPACEQMMCCLDLTDNFSDLVRLTIDDSCCKSKGLHAVYSQLRHLPKLKYVNIDPEMNGPGLWQLQRVLPHLQPSKLMVSEMPDFERFMTRESHRIIRSDGYTAEQRFTEDIMRAEHYEWNRPWVWRAEKDKDGRDGREAYFEALYSQRNAMTKEHLDAWDNGDYEYEPPLRKGVWYETSSSGGVVTTRSWVVE